MTKTWTVWKFEKGAAVKVGEQVEDLDRPIDEEKQWREGRENGYPDCCIRYFVAGYRAVMKGARWPKDESVGYIRCPNCRTANRVWRSLTKSEIAFGKTLESAAEKALAKGGDDVFF